MIKCKHCKWHSGIGQKCKRHAPIVLPNLEYGSKAGGNPNKTETYFPYANEDDGICGDFELYGKYILVPREVDVALKIED